MMQEVTTRQRDFDATANGNFGAPGPGLPLQHCLI